MFRTCRVTFYSLLITSTHSLSPSLCNPLTHSDPRTPSRFLGPWLHSLARSPTCIITYSFTLAPTSPLTVLLPRLTPSHSPIYSLYAATPSVLVDASRLLSDPAGNVVLSHSGRVREPTTPELDSPGGSALPSTRAPWWTLSCQQGEQIVVVLAFEPSTLTATSLLRGKMYTWTCHVCLDVRTYAHVHAHLVPFYLSPSIPLEKSFSASTSLSISSAIKIPFFRLLLPLSPPPTI